MTNRPTRWLLVLGWVALIGCDRKAPPPPPTGAVTASPPGWPVAVVDVFGRRVELPRPPRRIASIAPSNTEMVFAVGAGDRLVGRTSLCNAPDAAHKVTSVGGMTPMTLNLEALVALRPDLVLATGGIQESLIPSFDRLKLPVVALDADDFAGVARNLRTVGSLVHQPEAGNRLADLFLARVETVRKRVAARTTERPRVLYLVADDPPMAAGPRTFLGQMIETAGGRNIFADVAVQYPRPSEEEILSRDPQVILLAEGPMSAGGAGASARIDRISRRSGWKEVAAVREHRIFVLNEDETSRPTPRLADGLEAMATALEPKRSPGTSPAR